MGLIQFPFVSLNAPPEFHGLDLVEQSLTLALANDDSIEVCSVDAKVIRHLVDPRKSFRSRVARNLRHVVI